MDRSNERNDRAEAEALKQVLARLELTASKLKEIFRLLQEPERVEAMMARYEEFVSGCLPVTVLDSNAGGSDDR